MIYCIFQRVIYHGVDGVGAGSVPELKRVHGIEAFAQVRLNGSRVTTSTQQLQQFLVG